MADDRKTVYVNDQPISIFDWAEVQHCVNAYDSDLYLKVRRGEAEIVDGRGQRIGWGGFAADGWRIYVRSVEPPSPPEAVSGEATVEGLMAAVTRLYDEGKMDSGMPDRLLEPLARAQAALVGGETWLALNLLDAFILEVEARAGEEIIAGAAGQLIAHARQVIANLP